MADDLGWQALETIQGLHRSIVADHRIAVNLTNLSSEKRSIRLQAFGNGVAVLHATWVSLLQTSCHPTEACFDSFS